MPDFTKGEWILIPQYHNNKSMFGISAFDGQNITPVALVENEYDANLFVHARKMFYMLKDICRVYNQKAQCKLEDNTPAFMMALMAEEKNINTTKQLLVRIETPETTITQNAENQIKPCPFCGGKAHLLPAYHGSSKVWHVVCSSCMASSMFNELPSTPIHYWNERMRLQNA